MQSRMPARDVEKFFRRLETDNPKGEIAVNVKEDADLFRALVGCLLSAQSRDANTLKAKTQLFALADTPQSILELDDDAVAAAINPCGLYNMKTRNLKKLCRAVITDCEGKIPRDRAGLMALPGIGRKCADIMLKFSYGDDVIAVDTHIHRVCNRTGLARGKNDESTARDLDARAPDWAKRHGHVWLLEFGKKICRSRAPKCRTCPVSDLCLYSDKTK